MDAQNSGFLSQSDLPVADPIREPVEAMWAELGNTGSWWNARERIAIIAQTRAADRCDLCIKKKAALSPDAVEEQHDAVGLLSAGVIDIIHRVATDPGRLSNEWLSRVLAEGLSEPAYVELIAVVAKAILVDRLCDGLGIAPPALPSPHEGLKPDKALPAGLRTKGAWVATVDPEHAEGELVDYFEQIGRVAGGARIMRAISLVPSEQISFTKTLRSLYTDDLMSLDNHKALLRPQMELIAATVSAANECFY